MSESVRRAVEILAEAGFKALPQPVAVGGVAFSFSATLVSTHSLDLVVIVDTFESAEEAMRREVVGLARALDNARSRRPLTAVLIGKRWNEATERAMTRVARVLHCPVFVDEAERDAALEDALAVLLPLELAAAPEEPEASWSSVKAELERDLKDASLAEVLTAAPKGRDTVQRRLVDYLAEPLAGVEDA